TNVTWYTKDSNRKTGESLGKDDFLRILTTQLSNQDPLKPMEDTDFIAQMAQFSSLEQIQNLNKSMQLQAATTMIGKAIKAEVMDEDGSELVYGQVISARELNGEMYLTLDSGREIASADAKTVMAMDGLLLEAQNLVDTRVYIRTRDSLGQENGYKEVEITGVKLIYGDTGIGAVRLIPGDLPKITPSLAKAQSLIGKDVLLKQFNQNGQESDLVIRARITGAQQDENGSVVMTTADGDQISFNSIYCLPEDTYDLRDLWNVAPKEETIDE
ncbi:MAG: flagellar hook capping FlgD N-terminal domain-containing protein, partial [Bacillota bacterium]